MTTILIDMDGVLADWGSEYGRELDSHGPHADRIPRHSNQTTFDLHHGRTQNERQIIDLVMELMSYRQLAPIAGARQAINEMNAAGHEVFIVTSPWLPNEKCASDKLAWVSEHLGPQWAARTVITKDKTLVRGDYLIDDKPEVTGSQTPEWEHVVFTQPYNHHVTRPRINSWGQWKEVIK